MKEYSELIKGIASILWPLIVVVIIIIFRPAVAGIIESARSRKFTLKIGGQELSMEEVNQQQRNLIADLQTQVNELHKKVEGSEISSRLTTAPVRKLAERRRSILWVDDQPKNNSVFVQQLSDRGITVDLAFSTADGLAKFSRGQYGLVISDMGRRENGTYNADAGLDLLRSIREKNNDIPFIVFCSSRGVREYRGEAIAQGATAITSSTTELYGILSSVFGESDY